jgi:carbamoyl-phosphate synthase large subunit
VFSTAKLRGVDPSLGPGMQSTGEVIGLHADPRVAMAKALLAASLLPPRPRPGASAALLSLADRDKPALPRLAAALSAAGYELEATPGTAAALASAGYPSRTVAKLADPATGGRHIVEAIRSGEVVLVVNTPSTSSGPVRDAAAIRHAAVAQGVLCVTSAETAVAVAEALDPALADAVAEVRSLEEWQRDARAAV